MDNTRYPTFTQYTQCAAPLTVRMSLQFWELALQIEYGDGCFIVRSMRSSTDFLVLATGRCSIITQCQAHIDLWVVYMRHTQNHSSRVRGFRYWYYKLWPSAGFVLIMFYHSAFLVWVRLTCWCWLHAWCPPCMHVRPRHPQDLRREEIQKARKLKKMPVCFAVGLQWATCTQVRIPQPLAFAAP